MKGVIIYKVKVKKPGEIREYGLQDLPCKLIKLIDGKFLKEVARLN